MTAKILFADGSEIDSSELTAGQRLMVEDGLPLGAIVPAVERSAAWKGRKLTSLLRDVKEPAKNEDPATKALRKEIEAAASRNKAERFARLNELRAQKENQAMKTEQKPKASKADQVAGLRKRRATEKGASSSKPKADSKKAAKAKARTAAGPKPATGAPKVIRPGSKLEIVVGLLTRKSGCTAAEVLAATEWPAVSMPQQARAAGLTLRQEKDGKITRYWGS
jgi:hypothetical protein